MRTLNVLLALTAASAAIACSDISTEPAVDPAPTTSLCGPSPAGVSVGGIGAIGDASATPVRRVILMGGSSEDDDASRIFAEGAGGGDVLIMRASGSTTSYPAYFINTLTPSPEPASAVTVRIDSPAAGATAGVLCRVTNAEAIWLAGGSQWDYLGLWPSILHDSLSAATARGVPIGGTSAGAMSLGEGTFDAESGTVTSAEALANPHRPDVSVSLSPFAQPELAGIVVDSHFMQREREGRLLTFLAHFSRLRNGDPAVGVGLDERVALIIDQGRFTVHGPSGRAVWVYRTPGISDLPTGEALSMGIVQRVRLEPGQSGEWPLDFGAVVSTPLEVQGGVVTAGQPSGAESHDER